MFVVGGKLASYGASLPDGLDGNLSVKVQVTGSPSYAVMAFCYILGLVYSFMLAPHRLGVRCRSVVARDSCYGHGARICCKLAVQFAIGLFISPASQNISWGLFIIFGVLCMLAAVQAFFTYPETAGKTIEEIELLFSKGAIKPWKTKPGDSLQDAKSEEVRVHNKGISEIEAIGRIASVSEKGKGGEILILREVA